MFLVEAGTRQEGTPCGAVVNVPKGVLDDPEFQSLQNVFVTELPSQCVPY